MLSVPSVRLTVPKAAAGEMVRGNLIDAVLNSPKKLAYIHAGAGFGKTTLLSQIATRAANAVWFSLDGEDDIFTFVNLLCEAIKQIFPEFDFSPSEYLPFFEKDNFVSMLAGTLICGIENIPTDFVLVMDDVHTIEEADVRKFIVSLFRYPPKNARICLGSREVPWNDLLPLQIRGELTELTQKELAFTREETAGLLGFDDPSIYHSTEGWPLALRSFKLLLENGISINDIPSYGHEALYTYLFHECISNLPGELVVFLQKSASFDELDPPMLDNVLNRKNTRLILDNGIEPEFTGQMMEFAGYSRKKAYMETLGAFAVYQDKDRQKPLKFRTKRERELLAFLLDAGEQGATKEQIYNALWWDSDSKNINNLIAVNLAHLKKDLECAGIGELVIYRENRYFICRDEIEYDIDLFERTCEEFKSRKTEELASRLLSLYKGEYLFGYEALWAAPQRIRYRKIYDEAQNFLHNRFP